MFLKAVRNILVKGQHIDEGTLFETDVDTANALLVTRKVEISTEAKKHKTKKADK